MTGVVTIAENAVRFPIYRSRTDHSVVNDMPSAKESFTITDANDKEAVQTRDGTTAIFVESGVVFKGDQDFVVTRSAINLEKAGALTKEKVTAIEKLLRPSLLTGRSVLVAGSKPGYFPFFAAQNGAASLLMLDQDKAYLEQMSKAAKHLGFEAFDVCESDLQQYTEPFDIVLALNEEQWLPLSSRSNGALEAMLAKLSKLAQYAVLIEAPVVPTSLQNDAQPVKSPSNDSVETDLDFEAALKKYFKRVEGAGEADGKRLFAAFQANNEIDLSCPLPEFPEGKKVISCRLLTEYGDLKYWSRVYDGGGIIFKQATRELVQRERAMLDKLDSASFPRVIDVREHGTSSVISLEKVVGSALEDSREEVTSSLERFTQFALDCLQILAELQKKGIEHRDIQAGNLLLREGKPVLIDFGWAVSKELPMFVPAGLISLSPDSQVCDAYSLGKLLSDLAAAKYPELLTIFDLMTEPEPAARITDATDLTALLQLLKTNAASSAGGEQSQTELLLKLISNLKINRSRLSAAHEKYSLLEQKTQADKDHRLAVLEGEYDKVVTEITKVIGELKRVISEKDELLGLLDERQKLIEGITQSQAWRLANQLQKSKKSIGSMFGKSP